MTKETKHPVWIVASHMIRNFRNTIIVYAAVLSVVVWGLEILSMKGIIPMEEETFGSIWKGATSSLKIFALVVGILLVPISLASFVSNGLTRRDYFRGNLIFMAVMSIMCVIALQISYVVGIAAISLADGDWTVLSSPLDGRVVLEHYLLVMIYSGAGMLIGLVFYRFDWRLAIPLSALAYAPTLLAELAYGVNGRAEGIGEWVASIRLSFPVQTMLVLLIWLLVVALNYLAIRRVVLRRKLV